MNILSIVLIRAPVELQMVFTIAGSADPIKYWHVLARMNNQLFQFREKLVVILSVLVDVLVSRISNLIYQTCR